MANSSFADNVVTTSSVLTKPNDNLPPLQTSSTVLSQSPFTDVMDANLTPSTPLSGLSDHQPTFSPQSHSTLKFASPGARMHARIPGYAAPKSVDLTTSSYSRTPATSPPKYQKVSESARGHKRTATGEMKISNPQAQFQSPGSIAVKRHARAISTDSAGSRIAELSVQLRARLSYAAAKVEKGWQVNGTDGNPGAAPRLKYSPSSPASVRSGSRRASTSQNTPTASPHHRRSVDSIGANGARGCRLVSSPQNIDHGSGPARISPTNRSTTYDLDSLSSGQKGSTPKLSLDPAHVPRLAPPVDIIPGQHNNTRRRPNPNDGAKNVADKYYKFGLQTIPASSRENSSTSTSSANAGWHIPETPPPIPSIGNAVTPVASDRPVLKQRTPSQNALMEKDAIETLLFMSSPENSGYHPNSQQSQRSDQSFPALTSAPPVSLSASSSGNPAAETHLRPVEGQKQLLSPMRPPRKVSFVENENRSGSSLGYTNHRNRVGLEHEAGDEIDRMLDAMGDSDSDMEDDWYTQFIHSGKDSSQTSADGQNGSGGPMVGAGQEFPR